MPAESLKRLTIQKKAMLGRLMYKTNAYINQLEREQCQNDPKIRQTDTLAKKNKYDLRLNTLRKEHTAAHIENKERHYNN